VGDGRRHEAGRRRPNGSNQPRRREQRRETLHRGFQVVPDRREYRAMTGQRQIMHSAAKQDRRADPGPGQPGRPG